MRLNIKMLHHYINLFKKFHERFKDILVLNKEEWDQLFNKFCKLKLIKDE